MIKIFEPKNWKDYELLDTGEGEKMERFGKYILVRPYENAFWKKTLAGKDWANADGRFQSSKEGGKSGWQLQKSLEKKWQMSYQGIKFLALPTPFRHLGFFPEQASHWEFIEEKIKSSNKPVKFLNLFGYTGVASLFALRAGAEVTHVDASAQSLKWAKENQNLNTELTEAPMRIIEDDAIKFLEREARRGNKYDCLVLDPPKFGRGPKGETWKFEDSFTKLLSLIPKVLSDEPLFVIITSYAIDSSSLSLGYALEEAMKHHKGQVEAGELCLKESSSGKLLPLANTAVWQRA